MTINNLDKSQIDVSLKDYLYQPKLTEKLKNLSGDFNQEIINEIVLWKISRYCEIDSETEDLLNQISKDSMELDALFTSKLLRRMLNISGMRIPMASTILRFKNPNIYQIIDQRAYRFLKGEALKTYFPNAEAQVAYYLDYLSELRSKCKEYEIPFDIADQVFYQLDKTENSKHKIKT